jgi:hypothetical protein
VGGRGMDVGGMAGVSVTVGVGVTVGVTVGVGGMGVLVGRGLARNWHAHSTPASIKRAGMQ